MRRRGFWRSIKFIVIRLLLCLIVSYVLCSGAIGMTFGNNISNTDINAEISLIYQPECKR